MKFRKILKFYKSLLSEKKFRKYFLFSSFTFLFFLFLGVFFAIANPEISLSFFESLSEKYFFANDYNFWQLFIFIFKNNLFIAIIAYLSGIIFGLPTFFILFVNSFVIGIVMQIALVKTNLLTVFLSLAPHGIFEIPAILFALSAGFMLGNALFNFLFKGKPFKKDFLFTLSIFTTIVITLLFVAALVESGLIILFS